MTKNFLEHLYITKKNVDTNGEINIIHPAYWQANALSDIDHINVTVLFYFDDFIQ